MRESAYGRSRFLNDRMDRWLGIPVLILSLGCVAALFLHWTGATFLDPRLEIEIKLALCALVLAPIARIELSRRAISARTQLAVYGLAAVVSIIAYFNFGIFHGQNSATAVHPRIVHYWEQFHYQLGSKYFPELGFDGLYAASLAAQEESHPRRRLPASVRDLRNNRLKSIESLRPEMERVAGRFEPERWRQFVADNAHFLRAIPPAYMKRVLHDHGYNPTPAWTFVARLFNAHTPITQGSLVFMAGLDVLFLTVAFALVFHSFGARVGCAVLVLFGLGFAGRYGWIGGAFLRMDWFAAVLAALCMLKRTRPFLAGLLIGYAASVRLFPAAFLFGPGVLAVRAAWSGELPRFFLRLVVGFAVAIVLALALGATTGRGVQGWVEFSDRMHAYRLSAGRNLVGLEPVIVFGPQILQQAARTDRNATWDLPREDLWRVRSERRVGLLLVQGVSLFLLGAALWRSPPHEAAAASMAAIFIIMPAAGYYWVMLAAAAVCGRRVLLAALVFNLGMYAVYLVEPDVLVRYGVMSWCMALMFAVWILPDALKSLREGTSASAHSA